MRGGGRRRQSAPNALSTLGQSASPGAVRRQMLLGSTSNSLHHYKDLLPGHLQSIQGAIMQEGLSAGYLPAAFPKNEALRVGALRDLAIGEESEECFDRVVSLAQELLDCPISVISFVDVASQWVKAQVGLSNRGPFPRVSSICAHTFQTPQEVFVVPDLTTDLRFAKNPLVLGDPFWAFYAGAPLVTSDGFPIGTLCVIDYKPRTALSEKDQKRLKLLADQVMNEIQLRKALREASVTKEKMNALLENVFPPDIARRVLLDPSVHDVVECSVCFVDLAGFTTWTASQLDATVVVSFLDSLFCAFDDVVKTMDVCKIKTIGDGYLFAAGVPSYCPDHCRRAVRTALQFLVIMDEVNLRYHTAFELRIGIASGKVVAGVVGNTRFAYDLWGPTVNLASRVESHAPLGTVAMAPSTYVELSGDPQFIIEPLPQPSMIKGIGEMQLYVARDSLA